MKKINFLALALFALFVGAVIGCDSPKNVVNTSDKIGLTAAERKEKRGQ
jgi:hypothetical protein